MCDFTGSETWSCDVIIVAKQQGAVDVKVDVQEKKKCPQEKKKKKIDRQKHRTRKQKQI